MIVCLVGRAGVGKTTIAKAMEKHIKDSFVIDGDELRAETNNADIGIVGRTANMHLGLLRARRLSNLGFTVFVAMQLPIKKIREKYLRVEDIEIIVENIGKNPKDEMGYNKNFTPDYDNIVNKQILQKFTPEIFYKKFFKKVLVPARFQGFHKGHKVVLEEAKRISPNVTIALRVDKEDIINLDKNIALLESKGYIVVKSPNINEDWTDFANKYDVYVQGNPMVIERFKNSSIKLHHIPRYGNVSGTGIRENLQNSSHQIDSDVKILLKGAISDIN